MLGGPQHSNGCRETSLLELRLVGRGVAQEHNQPLILFVHPMVPLDVGLCLTVSVLHLGHLSMNPLGNAFFRSREQEELTPLGTTDGLNLMLILFPSLLGCQEADSHNSN